MESNLMDFIDKQIRDLGEPYDKDVFHYTKMSNLFRIITEEGIVFHAGRYDSMNDPNDSMYLTYLENQKRFQDGTFELFGDFCVEDINAYLVSFSCNQDNSLMWRLYDADICLHVNPSIIHEHCIKSNCVHTHMGNISYVDKPQDVPNVRELMCRSEKEPKNKEQLEFEACVALSFGKHKDFSAENEWRIACFDDDGDIWSKVMEKGVRYGSLWLYRELRLPKDCLTAITIRTYDKELFANLCDQISIVLNEYAYPITKNDIYRTKTAQLR